MMAADRKGNALLMVLGKPKAPGADAGDNSGDAGMDASGAYDDDLKVALGDLAAALGVTVKDPDRGIEALKTIHDLCDRASGETQYMPRTFRVAQIRDRVRELLDAEQMRALSDLELNKRISSSYARYYAKLVMPGLGFPSETTQTITATGTDTYTLNSDHFA